MTLSLGWDSLEKRRYVNSVTMMYKVVYNLVYILFVIQFSLMHIFANSNAYKYSLFPKGDSPLEQTA